MEAFFPSIDDMDDVARLSRTGMIASIIFAALTLFGVMMYWFLYKDQAQSGGYAQSELIAVFITSALFIAFSLWAAWRIGIGKGYVSAILMLLLLGLDIVMRLTQGFPGALYIAAAIYMLFGFINGIRATWAARTLREKQVDASVF